ncbi:MAG TPA: hypothetical protein VE954_31490 [Oligoflexus sp.]|uniref:hypothetical protein n=1 Tax=Oligoflexus sp. TaxID=1971216 RepID=UPI002D57C40A|nr:hypothetical protein [Oligoflexus sp.]HYX37649.1 hypothetical protein [Oligoflexus sp.]
MHKPEHDGAEQPQSDALDKPGHWVYSRYITRNGRRIYRKHGKCFRFWVED